MLSDLTHPAWMYLKAALFVVAGTTAAVLLWIDRPTLRTAALVVITVWSFARAYYFAFYVVERYIDPQYRFAGLA